MKKFCSTCENILQHVCENILQHVCENILQHVCEKVQQRMCEKILQHVCEKNIYSTREKQLTARNFTPSHQRSNSVLPKINNSLTTPRLLFIKTQQTRKLTYRKYVSYQISFHGSLTLRQLNSSFQSNDGISIGVHFDGLLDVSFHNRETISPNLDSSYFLGVSIVKKKQSRQKSFKCGMGEV